MQLQDRVNVNWSLYRVFLCVRVRNDHYGADYSGSGMQ